MGVNAVRFERANNPNWPLPADYDALSAEGQREARRAVVRMRSTPEDDVVSWSFFRDYYLTYEDSGWYDQWVEPAPAHYEWVWNCAAYDRLIMGAHRGSAKSTIFLEMCLRDLVTTPYLAPRGWNRFSNSLLVYSSDTFVEERFDALMFQIEGNQRLIEDFGDLKPTRGSAGQWNHHALMLKNRSGLRGASAESRTLRGKRPQRVLIDDIEYDPKQGTDIDKLIEQAHTMMFQIVLPMLRKGAKLNMIGTPIKRRMFLWRMINNEESDSALDKKRWFLKIYPGVSPDYDFDAPDESKIFWPAENGPEEVAIKRAEWKNFDAEFLCNPGAEAEKSLILDREKNFYRLSGVENPSDSEWPLLSSSQITFLNAERHQGKITHVPVTKNFGEYFSGCTRFITVDPARKTASHNDYSVIHVFAIDKYNQLFSLDLWMGRAKYIPLTRLIWKYALKWQASTIGCESESVDILMTQQLRDTAHIFMQEHGWCPRIIPVIYSRGKMRQTAGKSLGSDKFDKSARASALEPRVTAGLLKLPAYRTQEYAYNALVGQMEQFDGDTDNLPHDDALDSVAMAQFIIKAKRTHAPTESATRDPLVEMLIAGRTTTPEGVSIAECIDFTHVTDAEMDRLLEAKAAGRRGANTHRKEFQWTQQCGPLFCP